MNQIISENNNYVESCHQLAQLDNGKITLAMAQYGGWHELGTVTENAMTGAEALAISGLDQLSYSKVPNNVDINGCPHWTGGFSIVRNDCQPNKIIAPHVGERYTIFTPTDCVDVFNDLFEAGLQIETCGAIADGARIWLQARMPKSNFSAQINGDEIAQYLHGTTTFDGSGSTRFFPTTFRAVCANTHRIAMSDATEGIALRHTRNATNRKSQVKTALMLASRDFAKYVEMGNTLANIKIDQNAYFGQMADNILDKQIAGMFVNDAVVRNGELLRAIGKLDDSNEQHKANLALARYQKARVSMLDSIMALSAQESNGFGANDAWHSFNTISELADHGGIVKFRGVEGIQLAEAQQLGKLFGKADQIKQIAWSMAHNFATVS